MRPQRPNLRIADPSSPDWGLLTAPALMPALTAVVTTPSKIALDAAVAGAPVAIAAYDSDFPVYRSLPSLRAANDWEAFVSGAIKNQRGPAPESLRQFVNDVAGGGRGAADMLEAIATRSRH